MHGDRKARSAHRSLGVAVLAVVLLGGICLAPVAQADANVVPDPVFRACLNGYLGQSADADIMAGQLESLKGGGVPNEDAPGVKPGVFCSIEEIQETADSFGWSAPVTSIVGAQYLTQVKGLYFSSDSITDLSPLKNLTGLQVLAIDGNPVTDISPLAGLTGLTSLYLANTPVSDISPLAGLRGLKYLDLSGSAVTDLTPLVGMPNLSSLNMPDIADLTVPANLGLAYTLGDSDQTAFTITAKTGTTLVMPSSIFGSISPIFTEADVAIGGVVGDWAVVSGDATIATDATGPGVWQTWRGPSVKIGGPGTVVLSWIAPPTYPPYAATVTITVTNTPVLFVDVPVSSQYYAAIRWLADNGVTTGTAPTTYSPSNNVTREQMAAFLYRLAGSPSISIPTVPTFSDVPVINQYYQAIEWLKQAGVTTGTTPTTYSPSNNVTREQMAALLYRLASKQLECGNLPNSINCYD